jgi:hypothetical protein
MHMISVAPPVVDGALAVVVDASSRTVAVWKGRSRIELHDVGGAWQQTVSPYPAGQPGLWTRQEVLTYAADALRAVVPPEGRHSTPQDQDGIRISTDDLQRAWLLRAKSSGYALWDGGDTVDVYTAEGTHLRAVRVPSADLSTLSHLLLDLLALARRDETAALGGAPA